MLTLAEVLADAAASPGFEGIGIVSVSSRSTEGKTPLHWMATLGDAHGAQLLLEAGADVDAADSEGNSALHEAVLMRQHGVVGVLVRAGAQAHLENAAGETPFGIAATGGDAPILNELKNAC